MKYLVAAVAVFAGLSVAQQLIPGLPQCGVSDSRFSTLDCLLMLPRNDVLETCWKKQRSLDALPLMRYASARTRHLAKASMIVPMSRATVPRIGIRNV